MLDMIQLREPLSHLGHCLAVGHEPLAIDKQRGEPIFFLEQGWVRLCLCARCGLVYYEGSNKTDEEISAG